MDENASCMHKTTAATDVVAFCLQFLVVIVAGHIIVVVVVVVFAIIQYLFCLWVYVCLRVECEMVDGVICYLRLFCATAAAVASSGEKPTCPESEDGEGHQKHLRHPRQ